jgi:acyl-coenzyme A synthetase/AMP-(fatty) acid ligase
MNLLHESWRCIAAADPGRTALQAPDGSLSFSRLEERSLRLSALLHTHRGCNALIALPFSSDYYVALLACMRSKVAACPVDLALPREMLSAQISRLSVSCIIARQDTLLTETPPGIPVFFIDVCDDYPPAGEASFSDAERTAGVEDAPLLRLFTSGSSGEQSLVTIGSRSMAHDVLCTPKMLGIGKGDVLCSLGSHVSAMQIYAFWRCVLNGITFVPIDPKAEGITGACDRLLCVQPGILRGHPTIVGEILESCRPIGVLQNTSRLILGGEPIKASKLKSFMDILPCLDTITHNYSSTEALFISAFTAKPDRFLGVERIPVGHPQPGKDLFTCDENGMPLPIGEAGEIVVRSEHVCSEIQGRDSQRRLVSDPYTGVRTFRTGDLGRLRNDGMLEHLGRVDRQIKINGIRIDPYIVEQCIESHAGVCSCMVSEVEFNGRRVLAAVFTSQTDIGTESLRKHIIPSLPVSHHPSVFLRFDSIPVTGRGKPALAEIDRMIQERLSIEERVEGHGLSTPTEHRLAAIWSGLLGVEVPNRDADFFRLGGYSLKAMRLAGMVKKEFNVFMPLSELYTDGRLERLATYIDESRGREGDSPLKESDTYKTYFAWKGAGPRKVYSFFLGSRSIVKAARLCRWEWSVIELMDPQVQKGETPDQPVENLAPIYADAILAEHREGPIVLLGNCVSGFDAYATACHLQHRTDDPIHVLLFDTRYRYSVQSGVQVLIKGSPSGSSLTNSTFNSFAGVVRRLAESGMRGSGTAKRVIRVCFREALAYGLFDPEWYISRYPDIAECGADPLSHYLSFGWREFRDSSLIFNRSVYESVCPDFQNGRQDPLLHYILSGRFKKSVRTAVRELSVSKEESDGILASGWFDASWYASEYPSVAYHGRIPLDHYMAIGWRFERKPFPDYDPEEFSRTFPGFKPGKTNPLRHLLSMGAIPRRPGRGIERSPQEGLDSSVCNARGEESITHDSITLPTPFDPEYIPADDSELIRQRTIVRSPYVPGNFGGEVYLFLNQFLFDRHPTNGWRSGPHVNIHSIRINGSHFTCLEDDIKTNAWKVDAVIRKILTQGTQAPNP